jgi:hypothetical protein
MMLNTLNYLSLVFIAMATITGILIGPQLKSRPYQLMMVYLIITLVSSIALTITARYQIRNHAISNLYQYLRFPILAWIYFELFKWQKRKGKYLPKLLWILTPIVLVYCLVELGVHKLHTPYVMVGSVFIILCILLFLYNMFASEVLLSPFHYPFFWSSLGMFFFLLLLMITRGIMTTLISNIQVAKVASIVLQAYNCILYSLISFDFILARKQVRQQQAAMLG